MAFSGRHQRVAAIAIGALLALGLASCSSSASNTGGAGSSTPNGSAPGGSSSGATGGTASLGKRTIGIEGIVLQESELIKNMVAGVHDAADALGWSVVSVDPLGDPLKIQNDMLSLVNQHVSAILTFALDAPALSRGIAAAKAAHIPVISVGVEPDPATSNQFDAVIAPGEQAWGDQMGNYILQHLPKGGIVSMINDPPYTGYKSTDIATDMVKSKGYPLLQRMTYTAGNLAQTLGADTRNAVQAHPDLKYIICTGDPTPAIIEPVLKQLNRSDVAIIGRFDDQPTLDMMRHGGNNVTVATDDALPGLMAVDQLAAYWTHGTPLHSVTTGFPFTVVTKANVPASGSVYPESKTLATYTAKWKQEYGIR